MLQLHSQPGLEHSVRLRRGGEEGVSSVGGGGFWGSRVRVAN